MIDRPPRLHESATLVVWACHALSASEKAVWWHAWRLDLTVQDGCWLGAQALAERLGLETHTVEQYRARLRRLGLLHSFARPQARNMGWVATLPANAVPASTKIAEVAGAEAVRLAGVLDLYITDKEAWRVRSGEKSDQHVYRRKSATGIEVRPPHGSGSGFDVSGTEGGQGGGLHPPASEEAQLPLHPQADLEVSAHATRARGPQPEEGVGAHAPGRMEEELRATGTDDALPLSSDRETAEIQRRILGMRGKQPGQGDGGR